MDIRTIDRNLYVINIKNKSKDIENIICTDRNEEKNNTYSLVMIKNQVIAYDVMPLFTEQLKNRSFSDYIDCFSENGCFFAMFKYTGEKLLCRRLDEDKLKLSERLEVIKNLTEKMVILQMPYCIQSDLLAGENITVSQSLKVGFEYNLLDVGGYNLVSFSDVQKNLRNIIEKVFRREIADKVSNELLNFSSHLKKGMYKSYMEIYSDFMIVYEDLSNKIKTNSLIPKSRLAAFLEKIKNTFKLIKPILAIIIIIAAIGYLLYNVIDIGAEDKSQYRTYKSIGELDIREYQEKPDDTSDTSQTSPE